MTSFIDDDGNELDYSGKDFSITKQVISFYNFKIKADASVNIKIPYNSKNCRILNWFGNQQVSPTVRKVFNVVKNGNKENRGYLAIAAVNDDEFEMFFVTGNAGWFNLWDFNCNEITTTKYDANILASGSSSWPHYTATEGIVVPVVDFIFQGNLWENNFAVPFLHVGDDSSSFDVFNSFMQGLPCLYVHTLLKLLANHSGTSITGNIFNDPFFRTVVITPESLEGWDTYDYKRGGKLYGNIIKPEYIAPKMKAVEMMKWVAFSFGCIVSFDNDSNSISVDMIDRIPKSSAQDWSEYYISHETENSRYYNKYFVTVKEPQEKTIKNYNIQRPQRYGELIVETDKNDGSETQLYQSPFLPSYDVVGESLSRWATPIVDYYSLEDDEAFSFSSVTDSGGKAKFNGSGNYPWSTATASAGLIIRVTSGAYSGYHWRDASGTDTNAEFESGSAFYGNSSGTFYTQKMTRHNGHRVLSVIPSVSANAVQQFSTITLGGFGSPTMSTISTAYFSKLTSIYSTLNSSNQGLSYGEIDEAGRNDITLSEKYMNTYLAILNRPPIRALMLLPENVFKTFNFGYIYLNTEKLQGYFLVEKIENYVDSSSPVYVSIV